jgi:hypothetical protein
VAASVYGNPDEQSPEAVIATWDSTRTWRERALSVLNDLPMIIDDTKRVARREHVSTAIYDVASGRGRGRGTVRGTARTSTFRTILFTSGEAPATSFTEDGGTRARVLTVWGSPFGETSEETSRLVPALDAEIKANYGHAGLRFVQYLLENSDRWDAWRDDFRERVEQYRERAGDNPVANRLANLFAVLAMAARLAHEALDLPWDCADPIDGLWDELVREASEADRAAAALQYVVAWAYGHQSQFYSDHRGYSVPHGAYVGRWDRDIMPVPGRTHEEDGSWEWIGILPNVLNQVLTEGGFEPEPIRRSWRDRGWLMMSNGQPRRKVRLGNAGATWVVAIRREAVQEVDGVAPCQAEDHDNAQRTDPGPDQPGGSPMAADQVPQQRSEVAVRVGQGTCLSPDRTRRTEGAAGHREEARGTSPSWSGPPRPR